MKEKEKGKPDEVRIPKICLGGRGGGGGKWGKWGKPRKNAYDDVGSSADVIGFLWAGGFGGFGAGLDGFCGMARDYDDDYDAYDAYDAYSSDDHDFLNFSIRGSLGYLLLA